VNEPVPVDAQETVPVGPTPLTVAVHVVEPPAAGEEGVQTTFVVVAACLNVTVTESELLRLFESPP